MSLAATPVSSVLHAQQQQSKSTDLNAASPANAAAFSFPSHHSFPPFFTLQPNPTTLGRQLALWSILIQSFCAAHGIFRLNISAPTVSATLFHNERINRRLDLLSIRRVVDYMVSADGDRRAEWDFGTVNKKRVKDGSEQDKNAAWIFWRRPEEWADLIYAWVDSTGQKGSVLTIYELREGDETGRQDWVGMDETFFRRCMDVLVKRGKAQIFGDEDGAGVKFF